MEKKICDFNGETVTVEAKWLTRRYAEKDLKAHNNVEHISVTPGILILPMMCGNKYSVMFVWKGSCVEKGKVHNIGFLGIWDGSVIDVPSICSFAPLNGQMTQIGDAQYRLNDKGVIEVNMS